MKKAFAAFLLMIIILSFPINIMAQGYVPAENEQLVDKVVAVVGDQIILLSDLRQQINNLMLAKNMDLNTPEHILQSLFREVLQDMINEQLLLVKAAQDSIEVDYHQVDSIEREQLEKIRSSTTPEDLAKIGLSEQQLRYMIREDAYKYVLTQTLSDQIASTLSVTPQDMDAWIVANRDSIPEMPEQFKISHILLYAKVSEEKKAEVKAQLQGLLDRIKNGGDFEALAKEFSQDPGSAQYDGDLGYFSRGMMVPEFDAAAFALEVGEISEIIETQYGYHFIKVTEIRGDDIRASHILLLLMPDENDIENIMAELRQFKADIESGTSKFEDIAKEYSEDEMSKNLGGKLQWLAREQGLASFVEAAEKLEKGQISDPFKSEYGYHILQLDDYKPAHTINVKDDNYLIRQLVMQQKRSQELQKVIDRLKENAYISIRLE